MPPTKRELLLACAVFLALPTLAELALRLARVSFDVQLYGPDRDLGWVLRPGITGRVSIETPQIVHINSQGFRDAERTYEKPADTYRIAVLGNSWTEALQVPIEKTYASLLQQNLNAGFCIRGKRVEVLNFGVAGYSTAQELLLLQHRVWNYHPDLVLLAFYPARDIANNVRELNNATTPESSPYFVLHGDRLVLDDSFRLLPALQPLQIRWRNFGLRFDEYFKVLQAIDALRRFGKIRSGMAAVKDRAEKSGVDNLEYTIYAPPKLPAMQEAWKVTEALFLKMRDDVKSHGVSFRIVTLATRPQVIPDASKQDELRKKLGVQNLSYADTRIREFGGHNGIAVTNLGPPLSAYAETHDIYLNGFSASNLGTGHWNETGHRVAAEAIVADLCRSEQTAIFVVPASTKE
jgi:hypothetical protein